MPIPNKKIGEKQSDFMIRCVPQVMRYHDKSQAIAICYRTFQGKMINLETYNDYPAAAKANAKKALDWRDEYGRDEVTAGTPVGWQRANQLAKGEKISRDVISRMAQFNRHRKNSEIDPELKSTPWKDNGYVAWLIWGGDEGVDWAINKIKEIDEKG